MTRFRTAKPSPQRFTIDASVFINAFNPEETGYAHSHRLLDRLRKSAATLIEPTLLFPEIAATIGRMQDDADLALQFANTVRQWQGMVVIGLDEVLAQQAAEIAAQHRLWGSDAVYAAVAMRFDTALVTLDREQQKRVAAVIRTTSPEQLLKTDF